MTPKSNELIPTRWSLLNRVKDLNDDRSWDEFYQLYSNLIYSAALKSGLTTGEAQEVVQETFISLAKRLPKFKTDPNAGSFKSFLLRITRRRITDQFRKRPPVHPHFSTASGETRRTSTVERVPDPASLNLDTFWEAEWEQNLLGAAMEGVKRQANLKQCQIYDLYVLKKWPVTKVSATLGVNIGQVYLAKHRISRLLRRELEKLKQRMNL